MNSNNADRVTTATNEKTRVNGRNECKLRKSSRQSSMPEIGRLSESVKGAAKAHVNTARGHVRVKQGKIAVGRKAHDVRRAIKVCIEERVRVVDGKDDKGIQGGNGEKEPEETSRGNW